MESEITVPGILKQCKTYVLPKDYADYAAMLGGWRIDPFDIHAPTLLRSYAKRPERLKEMVAPTEEQCEN